MIAYAALPIRSVTRCGTMPPGRRARADGTIWRAHIEDRANAGNILKACRQGTYSNDGRTPHIICRTPACEMSAMILQAITTASGGSFHLPGWLHANYLSEIDPAPTGTPAPCDRTLSLDQAATVVLSSVAVLGLAQPLGWIGDESRPTAHAPPTPEPAPVAQANNWEGACIAPAAQFARASIVLAQEHTGELINKLGAEPTPGSTEGDVQPWNMDGLAAVD